MATNNAINTPSITLGGAFTMSGAFTFTGTITGNTTITYPTSGTLATVGGNLGAATATSITFSPTTGGIVGTTTNDNAGAGKVGEFVSSVVLQGSPVSMTNATPTDITSISLTAGDWDVWGNILFNATFAGSSGFYAWISSTSATQPDLSIASIQVITGAASTTCGQAAPMLRFSLSGTTTIYLTGESATTGGSGLSGYGGIYARRIR